MGISVNGDDELVQNPGTMADTTVGSTFAGIPAILSGTGYSGGDIVVAKVEYEAVDDTLEESQWMTTAVTFEVYAAGGTPDDTVPSFDGSGPTWTTGVYYMTWAQTAGDGSVSSTETGPCRIVYCSYSDVRVIT